MTATDSDRLPRYRPWAVLLVAGLLVLTACYAQRNAGAARPGGPGAVIVERLGPGRWSVSAAGRTPERATDAAWYRGAVLARAAGYSHLQLLGYRVEGFDYANAPIATKNGDIAMPERVPERTAFLQLAGVNNPAAPLDCTAAAAAAMPCRNAPVDEVLATLGPRLGRTPAQTAAEVAAAGNAPADQPR